MFFHATAVVLLLSSVLITTTNAVCSDGYTQLEFGGNCYKAVLVTQSWVDAGYACTVENPKAYLVSIETQSESEALFNWLQVNGGWGFWTSGHLQNGQDPWYWASTSELVTYTAWAAGEPTGDADENCIQLYFQGNTNQDAYWRDNLCESYIYFVCEEPFV